MAKKTNKKQKIDQSAEKKKKKNKKEQKNVDVAEESEDSDSELANQPEKIHALLEPYTKDQLIEFLCDSALEKPTILEKIKKMADVDISHRKIFIRGLGWDTTREILVSVFKEFGEIEDCNVVIDRLTGKAKGFGFIVYKSRSSAKKALKQPQKRINNRVCTCQLASIGASGGLDSAGRKIYVSNVPEDVDAEKLRAFFAKFGEIELGPLGFDMITKKSRGYALFVYKTVEGARKVLEEPSKTFEGHQLQCSRATESAKAPKPGLPTVQNAQSPAVLAAVAAAQNMALINQTAAINPYANTLVTNPSTGLLSGPFNPLVSGQLNSSIVQPSLLPQSSLNNSSLLGAYGLSPSLSGSSSILGAYGTQGMSLQGVHSYQSSFGQSSSKFGSTGRNSTGYPTYMWLVSFWIFDAFFNYLYGHISITECFNPQVAFGMLFIFLLYFTLDFLTLSFLHEFSSLLFYVLTLKIVYYFWEVIFYCFTFFYFCLLSSISHLLLFI